MFQHAFKIWNNSEVSTHNILPLTIGEKSGLKIFLATVSDANNIQNNVVI